MPGFERDYNLVPFLGLVLTVVTMLWFAFQKIDVGYTYIMLFLVPIALLFSSFLFINENARNGIISKLKVPFETSTVGGATLVLLGWGVYLIINFVGGAISQGFSITSFNIPLAAAKTNILLQQTAQQLAVVTSVPAQLFTTVFVASFIEEFVFRFIVIFISYILVIFLYEGIMKKKPSHNTALVFAFIITGLAFAGVHKLNASYTTLSMFIISTLFSLLLSASIYYAGAFLSFTIGFHQANNFVWFVQQNGWAKTSTALMSPLGAAMIAYLVIMVIIVLNNLKPANKFLAQVIRDFRRGTRT
jgi:hypothetical protein